MKVDHQLIDSLYDLVCNRVVSRCQFNWDNDYDVDKTIYRDFDEYVFVKTRETIHHFAVKQRLMK